MLSIFVILAGIVLIIFIQFDRGYVKLHSATDPLQAQQNLIDHVYQTQVDRASEQDNPLVMKLNKPTVVIQTETERPTLLPEEPQSLTENPVRSATKPPTLANYETLTANTKSIQTAPSRLNYDAWQQTQIEEDYQMRLLHNNPWSPHFKAGY